MTADALDALVAKHDLAGHPFYRAWREGTLRREALSAYAVEYAPFIELIADGWATVGEDVHAAQEYAHAGMWETFRAGLGSRGEPGEGAPPSKETGCPEAHALLEEARTSFWDRADAIGALYAFEAQQPATSRSKLDGLRDHYGISGDAAAYFAAHADDNGEREMLRAHFAKLSAEEREAAMRSCERMCLAMWNALSGILGATASW
jgi:pyrroloquinoline-quinone synthase